jgi:hypothetical protein
MDDQFANQLLETLFEQIRSLDKKAVSVATKAGFEGSRKRIVASVIDGFVISDAKCHSRIRVQLKMNCGKIRCLKVE